MFLERKFIQAEKYIESGKIDQALELFEEVLIKFPQNKRAQLGKLSCKISAPESAINFVISLFEKNLYSDAIIEINKLISIYPNDENLFNIAGAINSRLKIYEKAEENYKKAIEIKPIFPEAFNNLAETLNNLKRFKEAKELCHKAINHFPEYAEAYNNLGNSLLNLAEFEKAIKYYNKSLELKNPNLCSVLNNLSLSFAYLGDYSSSIQIAFKTISLNSNYEETINTLAANSIYLNDLENESVEKFLSEKFHLFPNKSKLFVLTYRSINHYIRKNYDLSLYFSRELTKELSTFVSEGLVIDKKDHHFMKAYQVFIESLINYNINNKNLASKLNNNKILYHIGESHCLSFSHNNIKINKEIYSIKPLLVTGTKAWHLADQSHNKFKPFFKHQLSKIPDNSIVFISLGEIDCRENEGVISFHKKYNIDLSKVIKKTVDGYVKFVESYFQDLNIIRYYFSVAAPVISKVCNEELSSLRIKAIKMFNNELRISTKSFGANYIDSYSFTVNDNGISNNLYMIDDTHLSPKSLNNIEKLINS